MEKSVDPMFGCCLDICSSIEFLPIEDWNMDEEDAALLWKEKSLKTFFLSSSLGLFISPANAPVVGDDGRIFEVEKKTGESNRIEGLKEGGILRKEEGETGEGEIGKEAGGKDLNFGIISWLS